ncbi:zinc finger, CCHC-type containing protein [Tanacetum coccineum]|uniref:Zinc finger, CCHC-type containing protein n=1 Tax=Tanacetum coccineum TaxID=301880 RepID=A0ABQ4YL17_9ASTR
MLLTDSYARIVWRMIPVEAISPKIKVGEKYYNLQRTQLKKYMVKDASSKKFLISNFKNYKMVDSRPIMEQFNELLRILGQYTRHSDLSLVKLGVNLAHRGVSKVEESVKGTKKRLMDPSMNMTEERGKNKNNKQNKGKKHGFKENNGGSGSNKKPKLECWKCGKTGHFKRDCRSGNKKNNTSASGSGKGSKDQSQDQGSGYYNNGMFMLNLNKVPDDSGSVYMSSSTVVNSSLWYARIIHETTASYTPQQNSLAERKNRALKEMVNSMLSYSGLSEGFWGESMLAL